MTQNTVTVRIAGELKGPLKKLIKELKDDYGMPIFRSETDAVTRAVKDLLKKHAKKEAGS